MSCLRPSATANARAWSRSAGGRVYSAGKAIRAMARPAAWLTRYGKCPGVAEISRRAGLLGGKGGAGKGEPGSVAHSIRRSPGVVEIGRRAGIFSGKGDAGKGEPGNVARSIAWGVVLKLFRAGLVRRCAWSPGRDGYEATEQAAVRMRDGVARG